MNEGLANLKQCCGPEGSGIFNEKPYPARWCSASACMAWRWKPARSTLVYSPRGFARRQMTGITTGWETNWIEPPRPAWMTDAWSWDSARGQWQIGVPDAPEGFCGLAGEAA